MLRPGSVGLVGGSRRPPGSPSHGGVLGEHSWGVVLSRRALCSPGGGVSEEGRCRGAEDRPGAGGLHQPQGGEADGDDGGVRRHALRRAAADREAPQGDRRVPRGSLPPPASLQHPPRLSPCPSCGTASCPALCLPSRISAGCVGLSPRPCRGALGESWLPALVGAKGCVALGLLLPLCLPLILPPVCAGVLVGSISLPREAGV